MTQIKWTRALFLLVAVLTFVGCASSGGVSGGDMPKGPTDEEQILTLLDSVTTALQSGDVETMASYYSDDFMTNQGQDKAATVQFLNGVKEQGFLDGIEIDNTGRNITIDGDTAEVDGVGLSGAFGVLNLGFKLEKRDGSWVVVYQSQE